MRPRTSLGTGLAKAGVAVLLVFRMLEGTAAEEAAPAEFESLLPPKPSMLPAGNWGGLQGERKGEEFRQFLLSSMQGLKAVVDIEQEMRRLELSTRRQGRRKRELAKSRCFKDFDSLLKWNHVPGMICVSGLERSVASGTSRSPSPTPSSCLPFSFSTSRTYTLLAVHLLRCRQGGESSGHERLLGWGPLY